MLVVGEVILVSFAAMDAAANLWQHHHLDVFVFEEYCSILFVSPFVRDSVRERIGVNLAAAALVDAFFQEHGIKVGRKNAIGRDDDRFLPHPDRLTRDRSCQSPSPLRCQR